MLFCWLLAMFNYLTTIVNLNPSAELDGYYTLMDYYDESDLRHTAYTWLVDMFSSGFRNPRLILKKLKNLKNRMELIYWVITVIYFYPGSHPIYVNQFCVG